MDSIDGTSEKVSVDEDHKNALEEIKNIVFSMHPNIPPSPNGYSVGFFREIEGLWVQPLWKLLTAFNSKKSELHDRLQFDSMINGKLQGQSFKSHYS
ncbi:hypothetical protein GOBAR_AA23465 [Gossypium barbadense]|uniref:Uncharacterized protein n=1 Tax=Gossypium barbadense TaxID=3634 RepID=A0A2P5X1J4_GOSBA|nr:hypothetical protein GOBAR_AA23465 [Gossypium barbadense]